MLFLAVFCGFLAEYQLEHKIERDREKEYIHTLISDLQEDATALTDLISNYQQKGVELDSLIFLLNSTEIKNNGNSLYYYGRKANRLRFFSCTDRTIQQMKNSGAFRLVRRDEAANGILRYYSSINSLYVLQNHANDQTDEYRQISYSIFSPLIFQTIVNDSTENIIVRPVGNPSLLTYDKAALLRLTSILHYMQGSRLGIQRYYLELREKANALIALLKKSIQTQLQPSF